MELRVALVWLVLIWMFAAMVYVLTRPTSAPEQPTCVEFPRELRGYGQSVLAAEGALWLCVDAEEEWSQPSLITWTPVRCYRATPCGGER